MGGLVFVRVLYAGGNYNSNDNYGLFYTNANNNATNNNGSLGSRLLVSFSPRRLIHTAG